MPATRTSNSRRGRKSSAPVASKQQSDNSCNTRPANESEILDLPTIDALKAKVWDLIAQLKLSWNADFVTMEFAEDTSTFDRITAACKYRGVESDVLTSVFEFLSADGMKGLCCLLCSASTPSIEGLIDLADNAQEFKAAYSLNHGHVSDRHPSTNKHADRVAALLCFDSACLKRLLKCEYGCDFTVYGERHDSMTKHYKQCPLRDSASPSQKSRTKRRIKQARTARLKAVPHSTLTTTATPACASTSSGAPSSSPPSPLFGLSEIEAFNSISIPSYDPDPFMYPTPVSTAEFGPLLSTGVTSSPLLFAPSITDTSSLLMSSGTLQYDDLFTQTEVPAPEASIMDTLFPATVAVTPYNDLSRSTPPVDTFNTLPWSTPAFDSTPSYCYSDPQLGWYGNMPGFPLYSSVSAFSQPARQPFSLPALDLDSLLLRY